MTDIKTVQALVEALESFPGFAVDIGDERDTFVRKGKAALAEGRALIAQMQRDAVQPVAWPRRRETRAGSDLYALGWNECLAECKDAVPHPEAQALDSQFQQPDGHSTRASGVCATTTPAPDNKTGA